MMFIQKLNRIFNRQANVLIRLCFASGNKMQFRVGIRSDPPGKSCSIGFYRS